jgi:hypothetical protein
MFLTATCNVMSQRDSIRHRPSFLGIVQAREARRFAMLPTAASAVGHELSRLLLLPLLENDDELGDDELVLRATHFRLSPRLVSRERINELNRFGSLSAFVGGSFPLLTGKKKRAGQSRLSVGGR